MAEHFGEGKFGEHDERERAGIFDDAQAVARGHGKGVVAIDAEVERLIVPGGGEDDVGAVGDDDGAVGEDVGRDGGDDEDAAFGEENGATGGEGIGGGPGGGGDDETVGVIFGEGLGVDLDGDFDEFGTAAPADDDVVEGAFGEDDAAFAFDGDGQERALAEDVGFFDEALDGAVVAACTHAGEETEGAKINAEDGFELPGHFAQGAEDGAVAAEDDDDLGTVGELGDVEAIGAIQEQGGVFFQ